MVVDGTLKDFGEKGKKRNRSVVSDALYFMNVTLQRGDREPEPKPESLLSADFTQSFTSIKQISSLALFTQRLHIISRAVLCQFSADGGSHRAKDLRLHVCNSHRKLKRRDGDVMMMMWVFPRCSLVNLNQRTVYNHIDAVIMCSD